MVFYVTVCISGLSLRAEDVTRAEMNGIKRNVSYFWKEATMANPDEARESACLQLVNHINDELSAEGKKVTPGQLAEIKYMTMSRGANTCVLAYIAKAVFGINAGNSQKSVQSSAHSASQEQPSQEQPSQKQEMQTQSSSMPSSKPAASKPVEVPRTDKSVPKTGSSGNVIADELLECETLQKAIQRLTVMKQTRKISDFGMPQNCADAAAAYWLVCDSNQEVVTVLSPGANDKRKNLKTGQDQGLADFPGMYAVWFTIPK